MMRYLSKITNLIHKKSNILIYIYNINIFFAKIKFQKLPKTHNYKTRFVVFENTMMMSCYSHVNHVYSFPLEFSLDNPPSLDKISFNLS
jgi:hypothetical protein